MKLFEIDKSIREFWDKIMEQEGELTEEDLQKLNELEVARDEKVKAYGIIIRELKADIDDCKANMDRIKEISDRLKNRQEWLKSRLFEFMNNNNIQKFESIEVNISFRKSKSLEIDENAVLPSEFTRTKIEPDKTAITDFIKAGGIVEGCRIVEKQNIQVK